MYESISGARKVYALKARFFRTIRCMHLGIAMRDVRMLLIDCGEARQTTESRKTKSREYHNRSRRDIRRSLLKEVTNQLRKVRLGLTDPSLAKSSNHGVRLLGADGARSRRRLASEAAVRACLDVAAIRRILYLRGRCCCFEVSLNTKRLNITKIHQQHALKICFCIL